MNEEKKEKLDILEQKSRGRAIFFLGGFLLIIIGFGNKVDLGWWFIYSGSIGIVLTIILSIFDLCFFGLCVWSYISRK